MNKLAEKRLAYAAKTKEIDALVAVEDPTEEQVALAAALNAEVEALA